MAAGPKSAPQGGGQYSELVQRLGQIVEALEGGELSLEASLDRFAEGVSLVKQGEALLAQAEKRIEQLLSDDGRTAPLKVPESSPPAPALAARATPQKKPAPSQDELDDVPF
jgi:exodeoxyribonuclease VII small subunit